MLDIPMRRFEKAIYDKEIISEILNMIDVVNVGAFDDEYPYVIPLNYGYQITDEYLRIFVHGAKEGHKIQVWEKNPHVSATFSTFFNYPDHHYMHTNHDFRSVMARGIIRKMTGKNDASDYKIAFEALMDHNMRDHKDFAAKHCRMSDIYVIECDWNHVVGKSESPVRTVNDVPFPDVYNLPFNGNRHDYTDLISRKIEEEFQHMKKGEE